MKSATEIIDGIKTASENHSVDDAITHLEQLLALEITDEQILSSINFGDLSGYLENLLALESTDLKCQISKAIAEAAKIEEQRPKFTNAGLIKHLLGILKTHSDDTKSIELVIHTCRALGNICFVNDAAKSLITDEDGDETLINLFDYDFDAVEDDDLKKQYFKARGGLVSNYLIGLESEETIKRTIDLNLLEKITKILEKSVTDVDQYESLLLHSLPPLSILTENMSDLNFDPKLNKVLAHALKVCTNPEIAELILELLNYQAENDEVKLLLAKEGLCEMIYLLLEKNKEKVHTNHSKALMKSACDLIIIILTGDESMLYLYKTLLVKYMEAWLDSPDIGLQTTGVLALGNFARTDSHCIDMVQNKIVHKLIGILARNNGVDNDMRLQHALLSTLKNLVIPKVNKAAIIDAGLVDTILPMLEIHTPPVVFKLLGTLRMMVDGQEKLAQKLLQNEKLIKQLIVWSKSNEFAGVTGESFRLMAWIIKHAYQLNNRDTTTTPAEVLDDTSLKTFIQIDGAVAAMVSMLNTTHLVMQNEALIALSIISTIFHRKSQTDINLDELLVQAEFGEKLSEFIKKNADNMTKEIVENLQSFIKLLHVSERIVEHLGKYNIDELLKSIPSLVEYCTL